MKTFLDSKVYEVIKRNPVVGMFGVEVEVEGKALLPEVVSPAWVAVRDGSLKGEAREYVFTEPLLLDNTLAAVAQLYELLDGKINSSMRAGVHVHVNCLGLTMRQVFTVMAAYYCFEELLTEDLGEERQGNLFCLRLSDADYTNLEIERALSTKTLTSVFTNENLRYAALNLVSMSKFGSLEFRALRTPVTVGPVLDWVSILYQLWKNAQEKFKDPAELVTTMSVDGAAETAKALFGPYADKLISKPNFEQSVYEGIRSIQNWVFTTSWEK